MRGNTLFDHLLVALKELGGYFTFPGGDGEHFVVLRKADFDALTAPREVQLPLASASPTVTADEILEKINRDIALFQGQTEEVTNLNEAEVPLPPIAPETTADEFSLPAPRRVRFEPLRGDLPPELQE